MSEELEELLERLGLVLTDDPDFDHDEETFDKAKAAFVSALRAEAKDALGWQPIETADLSDLFGSSAIVLLFRDDGLVTTGNAMFLDGGRFVWACAYGENCADPRHPSEYLRVTATHFHPLPTPPHTGGEQPLKDALNHDHKHGDPDYSPGAAERDE